MDEAHFKVQVESDHIRKLTSAAPLTAVAELIWNAVDADATRVDVELEFDGLHTMTAVSVRDNGRGIPRADVESLFGHLGGSWKSRTPRSKGGRLLHGKEGKGRFRALALGRVADWVVRYRLDGRVFQYTISLIRDDLVDVRVSPEIELEGLVSTGVDVRVSELDRPFRSLLPEQSVQPLTQIFALYLTQYADVSIFVEQVQLDPTSVMADRQSFPLPAIVEDGQQYTAELEIIHWLVPSERSVFLCNSDGFPLHHLSPGIHTPDFDFCAYIKSAFVSELQLRGVLELSEMNAALQPVYEAALDTIKTYFRHRTITAARSEIDQWKAEDVYPFREEPETPVEVAERQVFDIVALNLNRHLTEFSSSSRQTKAFQLRMLRQAIERGPDELQIIMKEVLNLPPRKQQELAKLLEEADLANVISASKLVADRLKFLRGLDTLLFGTETRKLLKERSQLHRMLAENTWVFGEEFNLTVDDQSLTEVLRKHRKLIGEDVVIDSPVKRVDGKVGIIDLMLSRSVPRNHPDEREHLVVELKRPSVPVGADEITQIEKYAYTVAGDERFRDGKTRWSFWVISNDMDAFARQRARQKDKPRGLVAQTDEGVDIWVKTWSEVLDQCGARMRFVQDKLQARIDPEGSLRYLRHTYAKYLSGVITDDGEEAA